MKKLRGGVLIRENLAIALDTLCAHKLRSGLIVLSVSIGVAALMGVVSILLGLEEKITREVHSSEQTVLRVDKFEFLVTGLDDSVLHRKDITAEDAKAVRGECSLLQHVGFTVESGQGPFTLRAGNERSRMIKVIGAEPALMNTWSLDLEAGRMFTEEEVFHRAKVVVLGHSPRRDLFPYRDPIGKKLKIENDEYTVIGAFAEHKTLFGKVAENFALIPNTTYMATLWKEHDPSCVVGAVREGTSVELAKDEVIRVMRLRRRLKANQPNDFDVSTSDAALEFVNRVTAPIAGILGAISSIALLVGGIGVMNMMLVSVTERTGEIGIRKALGARCQDILWQFLVEAGILTGTGGVLGTSAGLIAALFISELTGLPSSPSPFYDLLAVVFSVGIGMFSGLYPAVRASKLDPMQAMNYAKT